MAKCPEVTCRLAICDEIFRNVSVRPNFSGNMLRPDGVEMGGSLCFPRSSTRPLPMIHVRIGEAKVSVQESGTPLANITSFRGVVPPFPSKYFGVVKTLSGLEKLWRRRRARGNQFEKTDNLCVVLPVQSYRVVKRGGITGKKRIGGDKDCVAIRVQAKKLMFEMVWNNTDDVDLKVVEPTGVRISRLRKVSPSGGRFNTDVGGGRCMGPLIPGEVSRETVSWDIDQAPPNGVYIAIARLFFGCGNGPVKVCLRVSFDGILKKRSCKIIDPNDRFSRQFFTVGFRM